MPAPSESPSTLVVVRKRSLGRQNQIRDRKKRCTIKKKTRKTVLFICYKNIHSSLNTGSLICHSALCINNLCSGGTSWLSESFTMTFRLADPQNRPIPIKLTFSGNSQEPIHGDDQCYVLCGQSHRCQYNHHGNQASLRDACCSDAGSSCCDTEWAVGGMERRVKTFNKGKQTNSTCALLVGGVE